MTPYWFNQKLPPSRHDIENAVRLSFWAAGLGDIYFTCVIPESPLKCTGVWRSAESLNIEWVPKDYLILQMRQSQPDLHKAFERVLGHKAFVSYRSHDDEIVIEWRVARADARYAELQQSGVRNLERLD